MYRKYKFGFRNYTVRIDITVLARLCEYFDCDENWKNNLNEKNISYVDGVCYGKEDEVEDDFFKYNKDDVYSYLYEISSVNDLLEEYTNITIIEIPEEQKKELLNIFQLDENEKLYVP